MKQIAVVMILLNISYGQFSRSQSVDIDEPHTYTPPRHYFQTSSFDEADQDDDDAAKNPLDRGPYFDISASRNVTALVGNTAYLNCRVRNLGNRTVLYPQQRDSGVYECQISTTPPVGYSMMLSVVEPITTIIGGPDLYIDTGSTVNLTCIVRHLPEPPPLIQWTHNEQEINYDSPRGGVSVITEKGDITTSYLLIQRARSTDSGKYTCLPSTANPMTVHVHVLNGEHPAAIQGSKGLGSSAVVVTFALLLLVLLATVRAFPVR
uniref:Ig-like domain-containing protein n=1 Tax=Anopheles quadriannulatus TaxID=34691 RepID=A0A182XKS4_ANOQN